MFSRLFFSKKSRENTLFMATSISGRGGARDGAGRPGEESSTTRISKRHQAMAKEFGKANGIKMREVIEKAIEAYCLGAKG